MVHKSTELKLALLFISITAIIFAIGLKCNYAQTPTEKYDIGWDLYTGDAADIAYGYEVWVWSNGDTTLADTNKVKIGFFRHDTLAAYSFREDTLTYAAYGIQYYFPVPGSTVQLIDVHESPLNGGYVKAWCRGQDKNGNWSEFAEASLQKEDKRILPKVANLMVFK